MANLNLANAAPEDINYLRKLMAMGQLTNEDLNSGTLSYSDTMAEPPPQNMLARLQQDAQAPMPPDALSQAVPGAGFQGLQSGQGVVQAGDGPIIRINSQAQQPMGVEGMADVTRPIEIAGRGKGYYSKDGTSAIINGQKVLLGYDREKTQANQDRQMKLQKFESDQAYSKAQMDKIDAETNILNQKPIGDKAPSGFRYKEDGTGMEPIPGGPADFKQQGVYNADTATLQSSMADLDRLATSANTILKNEDGLKGITGIQGVFPNIPGGAAANAQADLGSLKAQVGFSVLQAMRNASKTGGALGNVSDAEGKRLEAALGSLEKAQSYDQFKVRLADIVKFTEEAKDRLAGAYNTRYGNKVERSPDRPILDSSKKALIEEAKSAIARGAPRDAVNQRLKAQGLEPL